MKQNSTILLSAAVAMLLAMTGQHAFAQDIQVSEGWGNSQSSEGDFGGDTSEEDAMLQSLYAEEEDEDLTRMLQSEDYIFPTSITDNWHLIFQAGAANSWGSYDSHANWMKRNNFAAAFGIGKYLTPVNDVRILIHYDRGTGVRGADMKFPTEEEWAKLNGMVEADKVKYPYHRNQKELEGCLVPNHEHKTFPNGGNIFEDNLADYHLYRWNTIGISAAYLPNFTNLFLGYEPDRKFSFSGVMGIGLEHTWGYSDKNLSCTTVWAETPRQSRPRNLVSLQFGLACDYAITPRCRLTAELLENFLDDAYDGLISDEGWDGHLNMMLGLSWYLKGKHMDGRIQNRNPFEDKYLNYTEQIYKNREAIEDALANRGDSVTVVNVTKDVTYTLISFDEGAMEVPRLQQNNVYQTAEAYRRIKNSKIFITNSNKVDDSMFHQRAWSISKILHQRWQIPLSDVWVDADESHIQQLQIPDCKHYIIFIINEE